MLDISIGIKFGQIKYDGNIDNLTKDAFYGWSEGLNVGAGFGLDVTLSGERTALYKGGYMYMETATVGYGGSLNFGAMTNGTTYSWNDFWKLFK